MIAFWAQALREVILEDEGVVVCGVFGCVEQGDGLVIFQLIDEGIHGGGGVKLYAIALLELGPALHGVFVKPLAERGARGDVFGPEVVGEGALADAARPEPVD